MNYENDQWILFGVKQMDVFDRDNIAYVSVLVSGCGLRMALNFVYSAIVRYGLAPKIEDLSVRENEILRIRAKEVAGEKLLNEQEKSELTKALYVIECFQKR